MLASPLQLLDGDQGLRKGPQGLGHDLASALRPVVNHFVGALAQQKTVQQNLTARPTHLDTLPSSLRPRMETQLQTVQKHTQKARPTQQAVLTAPLISLRGGSTAHSAEADTESPFHPL